MIFLDTETCGFHGVPVLLQWAIDGGSVDLWEIWKMRIADTLDLIKRICSHKGGVCGFNLAFDWFHICKIGTIFDEVVKRYGPAALDWIPEDHIPEIVQCEMDARLGKCYKPVTAFDIMLHARKGQYQSTLDRKDIRIRRVPVQLAYKLSEKLNQLIKINPLYFARRKNKLDNPWQVMDIIRDDERIDKNFKDIVLKFSPSSALKAIAADALGADVTRFDEAGVHHNLHPEELGYAPFAFAVEDYRPDGNYVHSWPGKLKYHIRHWNESQIGRIYATNDVVYLQQLYDYFGRPDVGDDDSILACCVAAVRWRGYPVDIEAMKVLSAETKLKSKAAPMAPANVKKWIHADLDELELMGLGKGTGKKVLEKLKEYKVGCEACNGDGCEKCPHPAAIKAKAVLDARAAKKEDENYEKIIHAGRFHAGFKVIGALSTRMSGDNDLNPQGIKSTERVRQCFTLGDDEMPLCGGDMESFEVVIAMAVYNDPQLEKDLNETGLCSECAGSCVEVCPKCKGKEGKKEKCSVCNQTGLTGNPCPECKGVGQSKKKIHGVFASVLFDKPYDDIIRTKGTENDLYKKGKSGLFSQMYGGNENTLMDRLGLDLEAATRGANRWRTRYPGIGRAQQRITDMFCSMRQPNGIGSKVEWHEPADYISSLLGFRRYFTLENRICKTLFQLAENPPKDWLNIKVVVRRRDRDQTASGAVRSALFGAAFQIQAANLRAATNHEIQSTGAGITKRVQVAVWDLQPAGIAEWVVQPMNIHDEILAPIRKEFAEQLEKIVRTEVETFRPLVPLISIAWKNNLNSWAEK